MSFFPKSAWNGREIRATVSLKCFFQICTCESSLTRWWCCWGGWPAALAGPRCGCCFCSCFEGRGSPSRWGGGTVAGPDAGVSEALDPSVPPRSPWHFGSALWTCTSSSCELWGRACPVGVAPRRRGRDQRSCCCWTQSGSWAGSLIWGGSAGCLPDSCVQRRRCPGGSADGGGLHQPGERALCPSLSGARGSALGKRASWSWAPLSGPHPRGSPSWCHRLSLSPWKRRWWSEWCWCQKPWCNLPWCCWCCRAENSSCGGCQPSRGQQKCFWYPSACRGGRGILAWETARRDGS